MTHVARLALEWWRATGERSEARLFSLVEHFATTNGELDLIEHHREAAFADVKAWDAMTL